MRCEALHCTHNDGTGYCTDSDYVAIEENGQCSSYYVPSSIELTCSSNLEGDKTNGGSGI